ncbi:MAG TPA: GAF domain-containing protein, partial [Anaerolineae bacterium]|nr:GAF domain-containing protein [Anaerolineae bacterium]
MIKIRIRTIRARLLVAFVVMVLLPVLVLGSAVAIGGVRGFRQQVENHLGSVTILKEAEISSWQADLQFDLVMALTGEDVQRRAIVLLEGVQDPATVQLAESVLGTRFARVIEQTGRYQEIFMMDLNGNVLLSTDPTQKGTVRSSQAYFQEGLDGPYLQPPRYSPETMQAAAYAARPVTNYQGQVLGVLVGRASLAKLNAIMAERTGLGSTGETYLVAASHTLLTPTRLGVTNVWISTEGVDRAIDEKRNGFGLYANYAGLPVVSAFRWLPDMQAVLVAEQEQGEAFRPVYGMLTIAAGVGLLGVLLAVAAALRFTRGLAEPLAGLAQTATQIASGDLGRVATVDREDEIGTLARAFNSMTAQLRDLIGSLEERVAERTRELRRRSAYLEAAAEVGRAAASILEADLLIQQVVSLIHDEFALYFVGLYLVDETGEWAILSAATGEAGQKMLARRHKLRVAGTSMVGWCIANSEARVAQEAGEDAVRLATPELPNTRSEAALPLLSRGQVIGALTVQHTEAGFFDPDAIVVLQTMVEQVAVALDNARLFAERQAALETAQRAYGELSREAWAQILQGDRSLAYRSDEWGVSPDDAPWRSDAEMALALRSTIQGNGSDAEGKHWLA